MPSSTSSSERPFRVILVAAVLAALLAAGWDVFWRQRGFAPSVIDDVNLWTLWRRQADADPHVLALAGSSRLLMGLDLKTLRGHFPYRRIIQLSMNGGAPLAVLEDLADDEQFRGSVICEILPHQAYTDFPRGELWGGYRNRPLSQRLEAPLHVYLSKQTNLYLPDLGLLNVVREFARHRHLPAPGIFRFDQTRQGGLDYSHVSGADLAAMQEEARASYSAVGVPLAGADFERRIAELRDLATKICQRGGQVLFFRMISSTPVREAQSARFPDPLYWDIFRREVGFPCLNYAEVPGLTHFTCPEGAHLDQADTPAFTAVLADTIADRKLLPVSTAQAGTAASRR